MEAVQSKGKRIWSTIILITSVGVLLFYNWVQEAVADVHVLPKVERCDIAELTRETAAGRISEGGEKISAETLKILSEQTGLSTDTVRDLLLAGRGEELLNIQNLYFEPVLTESVDTTLVTISEWLVDEEGNRTTGMPLVDIRTGDILITKNSRFFGWRNGHAGLVVDAEKGLVLEALMLGTESCLCDIDKWENCPSFMVLRLKNSADAALTASEAADYARENLVDIPYVLWAGAFEGNKSTESPDKSEEVTILSGTQCAHLVWYAYMQEGIDLDSDGGIFVTPEDIRNSPYLEVVQQYGY